MWRRVDTVKMYWCYFIYIVYCCWLLHHLPVLKSQNETAHCPVHHMETVLEYYIINTWWLAQTKLLQWQMRALSARVGKGWLQYSSALLHSSEDQPSPVYMVVTLCQSSPVLQFQFSVSLTSLGTPVTDKRVGFQAVSMLSVLWPGICGSVMCAILKIGL